MVVRLHSDIFLTTALGLNGMNGTAKIYFSISEVCEQTGLEPHVLRYWESEFSQLRPKKNRAGNRAYRAKDITLINHIKHLLYEEKFTIPGAKKRLTDTKALLNEDDSSTEPDTTQEHIHSITTEQIPTLKAIKDELGEVLRILKE